MSPIEAAEILKNEAECMTRMIQHMKGRKSSDFLKKDLLNWLFMALQQHADFKNAMADFVFMMGQTYPDLQLTTTTTKENFGQTLNEAEPDDDMETPPFDLEFWMGLGDV